MHHKSQQKHISDDLLLQKQSMHSNRSSIAETTWKYLIWIGIHFRPANSHLPNNGQLGIHNFCLVVSYCCLDDCEKREL